MGIIYLIIHYFFLFLKIVLLTLLGGDRIHSRKIVCSKKINIYFQKLQAR